MSVLKQKSMKNG